MAEKKNETLGIRMNESMRLAAKGIADADGLTLSEFVINLIAREIEERRTYWARLNSIFSDDADGINVIRVDQCDTGFGQGGSRGGNNK